MIYEVHIPTVNGPMTVEMTGSNVSELHEQLTSFYNENYEAIENDPEGVVEDEINEDAGNENRI